MAAKRIVIGCLCEMRTHNARTDICRTFKIGINHSVDITGLPKFKIGHKTLTTPILGVICQWQAKT